MQRLDTPLQLEEGGVSFVYAILLKDIDSLDEYYSSAAYGNQNETYILKSNGTRIHDGHAQQNSIQAYNVLKALEEMEDQSIPDLRAALAESDTICAHFTQDGTEYYYCITSVPEYDTLLLFLIPADCVASGTVNMVGAVVRTQMKTKGQRFEVYSRDLKHECVVMDKLRLNQILLNLLSNAFKYTPEGGRITLTIQELPQHAKQLAHYRFTVADNGYGMSPEYVKTIFRAFTREEDSVTSKIQGTGLGMAITKNLVDLMGGSITVESEKGKGSTFTVDLDLHISEQAMDRSFWKNNGITRLLAVDDEEDIVKNIRQTMEGTGVSVDCALNGQAAVHLVARAAQEGRPYDIVLIDWKMPGMNGVEAVRCIRRDCPKGAPLLVLTSYDWTEIEDAARAAGVDTFLAKPFFLTSFRQKVDAVLHRSAEPEDDAEESILNGMHILVAEDNEINAEILSELLDMTGATCDICENGQAVVEAFAASRPGQYRLVLMDVQMPVMNGYEAAKAIRALDHPLGQTIPIIAMTANAFAEDIRDALEAGMDAHVAKPVDMAVLEQTVRTVLEGNP